MIQRRQALVASLAAALAPLELWAQDARIPRLALVMGNGAYQSGRALKNPANDARAMSALLTEQGFEVVQVLDGTRQQMLDAVSTVQAKLNGNKGVGLLYYAGHGVQLSERNFLIPVDAKIAKAADVSAQAVDVQAVINAYRQAGCRMNILVLDACRDDPFGAASLKGLAPLDAPAGTFIAYATAPGNVAEDGEGQGNGLYTSFLLQELKRPGAKIEEVFKRVRYQVRQKSDGRQIPWESTSLEEEFSFSEGRVAAPVAPTVESVQRDYPVELEAWKRIANSKDVADYFDFLQRFPRSSLALAAQGRIDELKRPTLVVQGGGADGGNVSLFVERFRVGQRWSATNALPGGMTMKSDTVVKEGVDGGVILEQTLVMSTGSTSRIEQMFTVTGAHTGTRVFDGNGKKLTEIVKEVPEYVVPPGVLQVGQRWDISQVAASSGVSNSKVTFLGEGRVVGREPLTLGLGTFDTFRVTRRSKVQTETVIGGKAQAFPMEMDETIWFALNMPWPIKIVVRTKSGNAAPNETVTEMTAYTPPAKG